MEMEIHTFLGMGQFHQDVYSNFQKLKGAKENLESGSGDDSTNAPDDDDAHSKALKVINKIEETTKEAEPKSQ
jgi:hypothetical protein